MVKNSIVEISDRFLLCIRMLVVVGCCKQNVINPRRHTQPKDFIFIIIFWARGYEFIFICSTSDNDAVRYILRVVILFHSLFTASLCLSVCVRVIAADALCVCWKAWKVACPGDKWTLISSLYQQRQQKEKNYDLKYTRSSPFEHGLTTHTNTENMPNAWWPRTSFVHHRFLVRFSSPLPLMSRDKILLETWTVIKIGYLFHAFFFSGGKWRCRLWPWLSKKNYIHIFHRSISLRIIWFYNGYERIEMFSSTVYCWMTN